MLTVLSNDDLREQEESVEQEQLISSLAGEIQRQWQINRDHKAGIEPVLLECLRQRNGEYSPQELAEIRATTGGSEVYMMLTAAKTRAAISWISDIMMPASDKAWGLEPTPIPDLPPHIKAQTVQLLAAEVQNAQQQGVNPSNEQIEERTLEFKRRMLNALQTEADKLAESMETRIEDQLAEGGFTDALEQVIDDFCTFPAAILKGPVYQHRKGLKWGPQGEPIVADEIVEVDVRVSPFDIYPSPGASSIDEGTLIERCRYSRSELSGLRHAPGFDPEEIAEVLEEHSWGYLSDWVSLSDGAREFAEGKNSSEDDLIDALHYWGSVSGKSLMEWGLPGEIDPYDEYEVEAVLIGRHVIRVSLNQDPLNRRPYYKASFQNKPGSFWGISPPMLMRDIQRICNGTARALMNNMGMSSGPMAWLNIDYLPPGETVTGFHPWKMIQGVSPTGQTNSGKPIEFFQPDSHASELIAVYNTFEAKADDATNIPRYMYGNEKVAGAGQTAQGLAMLLEGATKGIKNAIRHIDAGVIRPRIERQYHNNMLYLDDPTIKGDLKVIARGSSALVAKAASQARRNEFLSITNNPVDQQIMGIQGRAEMLRTMAKDMDMPGLIPDDEEVMRRMQPQPDKSQNADQARLQIEQMRIQWEQQKLQLMLEDNDRERQIKDRLAQYGLQGDMMELAGRKELTLEQIKAKLGEVAMREENANRRFVAEKQIKAEYGSGI